MNGERALIYSRVRENQLDPSETRRHARRAAAGGDAGGAREVHVAVRRCCGCRSTAARWSSRSRPTCRAGELVQFGWVKFRASTGGSIHCRLGGDFGGGGNGAPSEDNPATIAMFLGISAPQPPTEHVRPRLRRGPHAAVGSPPWASSRFSSSGWSRGSSRASSLRAARRSAASRRSPSASSAR